MFTQAILSLKQEYIMITNKTKKKYYQALIEKNQEFESVFFVGVTTTGVFCRPTCPARKPKFEHCEFFVTSKEALLASFRPCKRCEPLCPPKHTSELIKKLLKGIEKNPEKRWRDKDFQELSVDASTARRQFKKRFGMTFVEYARARRIGLAMQQIRAGELVIEAQVSVGYESSSGFRDAFSRIMGTPPSKSEKSKIFHAAWLDTQLGPMLAIADDQCLYLLEFVDRRGLEKEIERLRIKTKSAIIPGRNKPISSIESELKDYFAGILTEFKTPLFLLGSPFQKRVWEEIKKIPSGTTRSYFDMADAVGKPTSYRAVAQANGANQCAIIIPCHRVINKSGELGGYGGGITRKKWLLEHERKNKQG
jgi:AraC family transcriptional regulator of adaptative response/methylated-DNA-[protein]-cysteine methyltransferase